MATTSTSKRSKKSQPASEDPTATPGGRWSKSAPHRLQRAYASDLDPAGWTLWRKYLFKRKSHSLAKLAAAGQSPLLWAIPPSATEETRQRVADLLALVSGDNQTFADVEHAAANWLAATESIDGDATLAWESLVWAEALPALAEQLPEHTWWKAAERLLELAATDGGSQDVLPSQLWHVELPLLLSYVLPELAGCEPLYQRAFQMLEETLVEPAHAEAILRGDHLDTLRPLLACWTRVRLLDRRLQGRLWDEPGRRQYDRLAETALRLSRADGRQSLSPLTSDKWNPKFLARVLKLCERGKTRRLGRLLQSGHGGNGHSAPKPSWQLEESSLAVLRVDWHRRSPQLVVNYGQPTLQSELTLGKTCYWSGDHTTEIRIDGKLIGAEQPWDQICWVSDDDIDYLEIELDLSDGVTVQRHFAYARHDRFLFMADVILGNRRAKIDYRTQLPLSAGRAFAGEKETREGFLAGDGAPPLRVLPLALNEWRVGSAPGSLVAENDSLVLRHSAEGRNLYVPLFIDLDPGRRAKEVTWRQLTVGKLRMAVPADEAVGYRVQIGRLQWLFYRALSEGATRTVLGKNLFNELLIGRFLPDGKVHTLVEIEA